MYVCMWAGVVGYRSARVGGGRGAVVGICGGIRSVEGTEGYDVDQINIGSAIGKRRHAVAI